MRLLCFSLAAFFITGAAHATATLTCDIRDTVLEVSLQAAVGSYSSVASLQGSLELKARGNQPKARVELTSANLLSQWIDEPELKLRLLAPSDGGAETELTILTRKRSETAFRGTYQLKVAAEGKTRKYAGRVICEMGY